MIFTKAGDRGWRRECGPRRGGLVRTARNSRGGRQTEDFRSCGHAALFVMQRDLPLLIDYVSRPREDPFKLRAEIVKGPIHAIVIFSCVYIAEIV